MMHGQKNIKFHFWICQGRAKFCFQSNYLLLTSNFNNLSVCEPWYDTRQAPPVR